MIVYHFAVVYRYLYFYDHFPDKGDASSALLMSVSLKCGLSAMLNCLPAEQHVFPVFFAVTKLLDDETELFAT